MYRVTLEHVLGIKREGDVLRVEPCVPRQWPGYRVTYRIPGAEYVIDIENPDRTGCGVLSLAVDGNAVDGGTILLVPNSGQHLVRVVLGSAAPAAAR